MTAARRVRTTDSSDLIIPPRPPAPSSATVIVAELGSCWHVEVSGTEVFVDGKPLRQAGLYEPFAFLAGRCETQAAEIERLRELVAGYEGAVAKAEAADCSTPCPECAGYGRIY
jgi:hypothetical protein